MYILQALYLSVFKPRSLVDHQKACDFVLRYGWTLIVVRWAYYSILFQFRDYQGRWMPFVPPPFGLSLDSYAVLQRTLALPFGLALMLALCLSLAAYLRIIKQRVPVITVLNILGVTFFLPFVIVQPIDQVIIALWGWALVPVSIVHTAVLVWESWATLEIISCLKTLRTSQKVVGIVILSAAWMIVTGPIWR